MKDNSQEIPAAICYIENDCETLFKESLDTDPNCVNAIIKEANEKTLLHLTCAQQKPKMTIALLEKGADFNLKDSSGKRAFEYADTETAKALADYVFNDKAIINIKLFNAMLWSYTKTNNTEAAVHLLDKLPKQVDQEIQLTFINPLHGACKNNNIDLILALLKKGAYFHLKDSSDKRAFEYTNKETAKALADYFFNDKANDKAIINIELFNAMLWSYTKTNNTEAAVHLLDKLPKQVDQEIQLTFINPLYAACKNNNIDLILSLLKKGANINLKYSSGKRAFEYTNKETAKAIINWLISSKEFDTLKIIKAYKNSHKNGKTKRIKIEKKHENLELSVIQEAEEDNIIFEDAKENAVEVNTTASTALRILEKISSKDKILPTLNSNFKTHKNNTDALNATLKTILTNTNINYANNEDNLKKLLAYHVITENNTMVEFLLDKFSELNANLEVKISESSQRLLHIACEKQNEAIILSLLKKGADFHLKDSSGKRAFEYANPKTAKVIAGYFLTKSDSKIIDLMLFYYVKNNNTELACHLLEQKSTTANLVESSSKKSLIHIACEKQNEAIILSLLKQGADFMAKDSSSKRAFEYANPKTAKIIVDYCVDSGKTECLDIMLTYYIRNNETKLTCYLLNKELTRTDLYVSKGEVKETLLHIACKNQNEAIISSLLKKGADFNLKDSSGKIAFSYLDSNTAERLTKEIKNINLQNKDAILKLIPLQSNEQQELLNLPKESNNKNNIEVKIQDNIIDENKIPYDAEANNHIENGVNHDIDSHNGIKLAGELLPQQI